MRDSACHLAQRAQPLLLHHGLLSLTQVVISLLQGAIDFRLMRRQRDMFAELFQKFAFAAAEAVGFAASGYQDPEDLAFKQQGSGYEGPETAARQALRKREVDLADIVLVDQSAANALGESVLI